MRLTVNQNVRGSSPRRGASLLKMSSVGGSGRSGKWFDSTSAGLSKEVRLLRGAFNIVYVTRQGSVCRALWWISSNRWRRPARAGRGRRKLPSLATSAREKDDRLASGCYSIGHLGLSSGAFEVALQKRARPLKPCQGRVDAKAFLRAFLHLLPP